MIKPSLNLQELRRRIYRKAKTEKQWRFWGIYYVHVCKLGTLKASYGEAKANDGSAGLDGESFQSIGDRRGTARAGWRPASVPGAHPAPAAAGWRRMPGTCRRAAIRAGPQGPSPRPRRSDRSSGSLGAYHVALGAPS